MKILIDLQDRETRRMLVESYIKNNFGDNFHVKDIAYTHYQTRYGEEAIVNFEADIERKDK